MAVIRRLFRFGLVLVLLLMMFAAGWVTGRTGIGSTVNPDSLTALEREFTERMRDVELVGTFTIAGREDRAPSADRYDITSVEKVGENLWRFNAGMSCCGVNGAIPIVVPMSFHGDTPMIEMTETSIPGVGTFTVRLIFYGDRYTGTWQHGKVGGHMSGRIEKRSAAGGPASGPPPAADAPPAARPE